MIRGDSEVVMSIPRMCHINVKFRTSEKVTVTLLIPQLKKKIVYFVLKSFIFLKKKKKGQNKTKKGTNRNH